MRISMPTFGLGTIKSLLENWTESNDEIQKKYKNCKNFLSDQKKTLDQEINSWGLQLIADIKNHMQQERDALQIQYTHYDNHLERRLANYKTLVEEQTVDEQALHDLKKEFDNLMNQCFQLQNVSKTINFPTTIGIFPFTDQTSENYEVLEVDDNRITTNQSAFESLGADRFTNDGRNPSRNFDRNPRPRTRERRNSSQDELETLRHCPQCFMLFPANCRPNDKLDHISDHDETH